MNLHDMSQPRVSLELCFLMVSLLHHIKFAYVEKLYTSSFIIK